VGDAGFARTERLIDAGADVIVDTAHGHSARVLEAVNRIKRLSNAVQVIAGNVATTEATQALIDAGADAIKVGIGPARSAPRALSRVSACRSSPQSWIWWRLRRRLTFR
jgi:2-methylisocitrate lyase-like PEP mutase family enzyme